MHQGFQTFKLNPDGMAKAQVIGESFDQLLTRLLSLCEGGASREIALVKTHMEIACFYAKKSMALQKVNQEETQGTQP